ncbi:hypothetical protein J6590_107766, partial [Homalodisca vitripennis]
SLRDALALTLLTEDEIAESCAVHQKVGKLIHLSNDPFQSRTLPSSLKVAQVTQSLRRVNDIFMVQIATSSRK